MLDVSITRGIALESSSGKRSAGDMQKSSMRRLGSFRSRSSCSTSSAMEHEDYEITIETDPDLRASVGESTVSSSGTSVTRPGGCVVGVLEKYVNFAKGWGRRICVVLPGRLDYYKARGSRTAALEDLGILLLRLRKEYGTVTCIGSCASNLDTNKQLQRRLIPRPFPKPQGSLHIAGVDLVPMKSDPTKFTLKHKHCDWLFRAETKEDCKEWLSLLSAAKHLALCPHHQGETPRHPANGAHAGAAAGVQGGTLAMVMEDFLHMDHLLSQLVVPEGGQTTLDELKRRLEGARRKVQTMILKSGQLVEGNGDMETPFMTNLIDLQLLPGEEKGLESGSDDGGFLDCESKSLSAEFAEESSYFYGGSGQPLSPHPHATGSPSSVPRSSSSPAGHASALHVSASLNTRYRRPQDDLHTGGPARSSVPLWLLTESQAERRRSLPPPQEEETSVSLMSVLLHHLKPGNDLSRICLPVYYNEPLSGLQKCCEELEYSELLDRAARKGVGSIDRLLLVAAFAVSSYSSSVGRIAKPFNPLLGETFELVCPEKKFRFLAEKVVHHPTVFAFHAEGAQWRLDGDAKMETKIWRQGIQVALQVIPKGLVRVRFSDGDEYQWNKLPTCVRGIFTGSPHSEHVGHLEIQNMATGHCCNLTFADHGMFRKPSRKVHGIVQHKENGTLPQVQLEGHWDQSLTYLGEDEEQSIWERNPPPEHSNRYHLTLFAMSLNEMTEGLEGKLPPTDCRFRPDLKALEQGQFKKANQEKLRLENKQRASRAAADEGVAHKPRWFVAQQGAQFGEQLVYEFTGEYWSCRDRRDFRDCRNIYN